MDINTIFITRYVADHAAAIDWYERLVGRPPDAVPVPSCREWQVAPGVLLQVIADDERAGGTTFAFSVDDLPAELARLHAAGLAVGGADQVGGFDGLEYAELTDPEGVGTGLLNESGVEH